MVLKKPFFFWIDNDDVVKKKKSNVELLCTSKRWEYELLCTGKAGNIILSYGGTPHSLLDRNKHAVAVSVHQYI